MILFTCKIEEERIKMNKLNRKGFTLIELLAVVVILAVILVITIPSVLDTMNTSKQNSLEDVTNVIQQYVSDQWTLSELQQNKLTFPAASNGKVTFTTYTDILAKTGYNASDITLTKVEVTVATGKVCVSATAPDTSKFYSKANTNTASVGC